MGRSIGLAFPSSEKNYKNQQKDCLLGASGHTCNPSYSEGCDREDCSSRTAQAKKLAMASQPIPSDSGIPHCATGEAEIVRLTAPGQTRQKTLQDPISMEKCWDGMCLPSH
jgi:hypothetical protein